MPSTSVRAESAEESLVRRCPVDCLFFRMFFGGLDHSFVGKNKTGRVSNIQSDSKNRTSQKIGR